MGNMLSFYSNDPSSNPAAVYNFSTEIVVEKSENKQKEAGIGPFKKTVYVKHLKVASN